MARVEPTYILVKVHPALAANARRALHRLHPGGADMVFHSDGSQGHYQGITTAQGMADWQQLDDLFENRMGLAKRLANRLRRRTDRSFG